MKLITDIKTEDIPTSVLSHKIEDTMILIPSSVAVYHTKRLLYKYGIENLPFILVENRLIDYLPTLNKFLDLSKINLSNIVSEEELESILIDYIGGDLDIMLYPRLKLLASNLPIQVKAVLKEKDMVSAKDKLHEVLTYGSNREDKYIYRLDVGKKESNSIKEGRLLLTAYNEQELAARVVKDNYDNYDNIVVVTEKLKKEIEMEVQDIGAYVSSIDRLDSRSKNIFLSIISILDIGVNDESELNDLMIFSCVGDEFHGKLSTFFRLCRITDLKSYISAIFQTLKLLNINDIPQRLRRKLDYLALSPYSRNIKKSRASIILKSLVQNISVQFESNKRSKVSICSLSESIWYDDPNTLFIVTEASENSYQGMSQLFQILLQNNDNFIFITESGEHKIHPILKLSLLLGKVKLLIEKDEGVKSEFFLPQARPVVQVEREHLLNQCSPSSIELLMQNPYIYYLKYILGIRKKEKYNTEDSAQLFGILLHEVMSKMKSSNSLEEARAVYKECIKDLDVRNIIKQELVSKLEKLLPWLLKIKREFEIDVRESFEEIRGEVKCSGLEVYAIADRVLKYKTGLTKILDYKTGTAPALIKVRNYLAPQLPIEGLIFGDGDDIELYYVQCNNNPEVRKIRFDRDKTKKFLRKLSKTFFCGSILSRRGKVFCYFGSL